MASSVIVGSIMADQVQPGRGAYTSCKCAARQMAKTLALELAPYAITVNVVQPGHIATNNNPSKRRPATIPLGRLGNPRDAANLVAFLCSPAASYITARPPADHCCRLSVLRCPAVGAPRSLDSHRVVCAALAIPRQGSVLNVDGGYTVGMVLPR